MKRLLFFLMILIPVRASAQQVDINTLLTEPFVDRPLTLHRGELQVEAGYLFRNSGKQYNRDGKVTSLSKEGVASLLHAWHLKVTLGILEFVEITAGASYLNTSVPKPDLVIGNSPSVGYISEIDEMSGFEDPYLFITTRIPWEFKTLDWSFHAGLSLPVAAYKPDQPEHTIYPSNPGGGSFELNYLYHSNPGKGVPGYFYGSEIKYRHDRLALMLNASFSSVLKETESRYWQSRLYSGQFNYREVSYVYKLGYKVDLSLFGCYQLYPWFVIQAGADHERAGGGWSEITGQRVANPDANLTHVFAAYEIQVSTHIRLQQSLRIPVMGKEHTADFGFFTSLSYNLIPFKGFYK
jgi:hypothetical protein